MCRLKFYDLIHFLSGQKVFMVNLKVGVWDTHVYGIMGKFSVVLQLEYSED